MPEPLRSYLTTQLKYDRQVRGILQRTASDLGHRIRLLDASEGVGARVRAAQLRAVLAEVDQTLRTGLYGQLGPVVANGADAAATAALGVAEGLDAVLVRAVGRASAEVLARSMAASARRGLVVERDRRERQLSNRVYENYSTVSGQIQDTIRTGLISGNSANELARTVYQFVSPTTPGGASYASMRLARTEINNAFHTQQIRSGQKPWVEWAVWNLSGSHRKPDQCNAYATRGKFPTDGVPDKPHPQCLCYLTYDTVSPDEFVNNFINGHYDDYLDDTIGKASTAEAHQPTPQGASPRRTRKKAR